MGSMSASDAAPLPRLGEVFFDVRGESRSMRLSWYADTGVAVFSIWQGSTCTGTFRLPITDLPRMVEALQRGPHARDEGMTGEQPAAREPRLPAAAVQPGPPVQPARPGGPARGRPSRPELLDRDIETGQTTAAVYSPPAEPDPAGYQAEPPLPDYPGGPPDVYSAPPQPGRRAKAPRRGESPPAPEFAGGAVHGDGGEELAGDPAEYAAGPAAPDFTGEYAAAAPAAGFTGEYAAGPAAPDFTGEYATPAPAADFPGERSSRRRGRDPGEGPGQYPAEPPPPDLPDGPSRGYSGGHSRRSSSGPTEGSSSGQARRSSRPTRGSSGGPTRGSSSGYRAPPPSGYPGEPSPGYLDEPGTARYPAGEPADRYLDEEAVTPGYPRDYQDGQDYGRYQDELAATEYGSPARPYVADVHDTDGPYDDPPERRKPRGRRRAEPAPDSFPYGPPPTDDGPRQRGRYPGRH
jgi:hypothetical protein